MRLFFSALGPAIAVLFLASSASACVGNGCPGYDGRPTSNFNVDASVLFGGLGTGKFTGKEGYINIEKVGNGVIDLKFKGSGGCAELNCGDFRYNVEGVAKEAVKVNGAAWSNVSGKETSVFNQGIVTSGFSLSVTPQSSSPD
ncbi:MAG: hypothetical protein AAB388_00485 [Patescibacteria group bacterium]